MRDQLYISRSFNKPYFSYDREKLRECQHDVVLRHRDDYDNYIKRFLNNKLDDKDREKNCNEHRSERRPEYRPEYRFKYRERKWDQ